MIGDAFHGGNHHRDTDLLRGCSDKGRGMKHAVRAEERAATKLEGHNVQRLAACPAPPVHSFCDYNSGQAGGGGAAFCGNFILYIFKAHDRCS
jgi:hypothetical protein